MGEASAVMPGAGLLPGTGLFGGQRSALFPSRTVQPDGSGFLSLSARLNGNRTPQPPRTLFWVSIWGRNTRKGLQPGPGGARLDPGAGKVRSPRQAPAGGWAVPRSRNPCAGQLPERPA